jgi:aspartyl-tRNA(Asn)/glutamyl-tRNA(Gln) amidotransferase subunit A
MSELHTLSLTQQISGLRKSKFSCMELIDTYIKRIEDINPSLNCFISLENKDVLYNQASESDKRYANNNPLPLDGIPIAHKDIFCTEGMLTTCGSKMLSNFIPPYSSTVVTKLKDSGVISLGKTNMDEFAMGSSNETSFYGPTKNPWNIEFVPGGSSGGSAACVAASLASAATGTDTGGSIRQPASLCGITGIKPTYGRVSRYGMIAFASSLDQGGIFAKSAEDTAYLLEMMSGHDPKDSTSLNTEVPKFSLEINNNLKNIKIGLPIEFFNQEIPIYLRKSIDETIKVLETLGASFKKVSLPNLDLGIAAYYVIAPAECSANLSRYDGVKFGYRCEDPIDLDDLYKRTREEGFGYEVKKRILTGTYALSAGYYDAYYLKAQKCRQLIANDFQEVFKEFDMILSPTAPDTAFKLGSKTKDPLSMYLEDIFTIPANLAGLPGISFPCGNNSGLPLGVQLIGNHLQESSLLKVAHNFQLETDWHLKRPII